MFNTAMIVIAFASSVWESLGNGTIAFALNRILPGNRSVIRGVALTALLMMGWFLAVQVPALFVAESMRNKPMFQLPLVSTIVAGAFRFVIGTAVGSAFGSWLISKIPATHAPTQTEPR